MVVTDEVVQREPVVARDEVHGVPGQPPVGLVQVGAATNSVGEEADEPGVPAPEAANVVAVFAVPLAPPPPEREAADLIQSRRVPRLRDELGVGEHAVLGDHFDNGRFDHDVALLVAAQNAGEVEAEPIDVHVPDPVPQTG